MGAECSPGSEHPHPHGASLAPVLTEGQHSNLRLMGEDSSRCDHRGSDDSHGGEVMTVMVVMADKVVMTVPMEVSCRRKEQRG